MPATPTVNSQVQRDLRITSETGLLQRVLVHTPGREMEMVSPANRMDLLFDDILFIGKAREEHELMGEVFEKIVGGPEGVLQVTDLLNDVFGEEDARYDFIEQLCRLDPSRNLQAFQQDLQRLSPEELHLFALTGISPLPIHMEPLPNLMFTRDLSAVVHEHVILSHAAMTARARESILINVIFHHHPAFAAHRGNLIELPPGVTFEGGDLLVASPNVVLIGHSERTTFGGVMTIAQELFARTDVEHVLMVDLPKQRFCMHLDTVFTFASPNECVVFPPMFAQEDHGNVVHFTRSDEPGRFFSQVRPNMKRALEEVLDYDLTYIPCGGTNTLNQHREQWTDGANFFALAPGVVIGYERNSRTFNQMREHGYRVVSAQSFLSYYEESEYQPGEKIAIKLEGNELSRGRGGPRCMTMPLSRKPL